MCLCAALTCVAQMTGLPAELQRPIIIFWAMKTFSAGISIPRSPLATITPSLSARISSKLTDRVRGMRLVAGIREQRGQRQQQHWHYQENIQIPATIRKKQDFVSGAWEHIEDSASRSKSKIYGRNPNPYIRAGSCDEDAGRYLNKDMSTHRIIKIKKSHLNQSCS